MVKKRKKKRSTATIALEIKRLRAANKAKEMQLRRMQLSLALKKKERIQRAMLEKELKELKDPRSAAFKRNLKRGAKIGGKGLLKGALFAAGGLGLITAKDVKAVKKAYRRGKK